MLKYAMMKWWHAMDHTTAHSFGQQYVKLGSYSNYSGGLVLVKPRSTFYWTLQYQAGVDGRAAVCNVESFTRPSDTRSLLLAATGGPEVGHGMVYFDSTLLYVLAASTPTPTPFVLFAYGSKPVRGVNLYVQFNARVAPTH